MLLASSAGCKAEDTPNSEVDGTADVIAAVDESRYRADLDFIAAPRPSGSAHWQAVQDRCAAALSAVGLDVELQTYDGGINVLGTLHGASASNEVVLVGAHYDSVNDCPGADDNASGVAGVLEIARVLATHDYARTLVFACWDEEETGLDGSSAFVAGFSPLQKLVAHYNFEMIGFASAEPGSQSVPFGFDQLFPEQVQQLEANENRGDFIAVVADSSSNAAASELVARARGVGLPTLRLDVPDTLKNSDLASDLRRSDHASFWRADLPGIMLTDTANFRNPNYHCESGSDIVVTLNLDFALRVVKATAAAASDMAKRQ
jgi:Zn-dependent M28 family amino/carboxypeptidase